MNGVWKGIKTRHKHQVVDSTGWVDGRINVKLHTIRAWVNPERLR